MVMIHYHRPQKVQDKKWSAWTLLAKYVQPCKETDSGSSSFQCIHTQCQEQQFDLAQ